MVLFRRFRLVFVRVALGVLVCYAFGIEQVFLFLS